MQLNQNFKLKLVRTFFIVHGLFGFILVLTGAWYTNNENENPAVDKIQKSANKFVDWILIMVGWLLILWTIIGWFTLVKKSRELDIICVFLNITMMLLQVKFLCILFASNEFRERKTMILVAVFVVSSISSAIHLFIFIIKYRTRFTHKGNIGKEIQVQNLKNTSVVHKLSFNPKVYHQSQFIELNYNNGS